MPSAARAPSSARIEQTTIQPAAARRGFDSSRPPCRFFVLGKCKFGDSCTFSHDQRDGRLPVCSFFEKNGSCRYGDDCMFLHGNGGSNGEERPASTSTTTILQAAAAGGSGSGGAGAGAASAQQQQEATAPAGAKSPTPVAGGARSGDDAAAAAAAAVAGEESLADSTEDTCGICLENIPAKGKRFGLLNCDHVYCLECLRTWRKSKGPQKDISRTCPECRKVSFFLVPSKEHLKGKAKLKAIQAYKQGLSKLPCKYHKPGNASGGGTTTVCPFGSRCFYAHLDEHGNDVKDRATPAAPAPLRRTCPYLRAGGGGGGSAGASRGGGANRGGGRSGGRGGTGAGERAGHGHGASGRVFSDIHVLYPFGGDGTAARFAPDIMMGSHGSRQHMSVIMRLQQLMLDAAAEDL
ncbi:unnamed protein product [Ectocarpus sp. CCAP 1310/34]|nr:unnamed protein product [Ectocarpus sp. CCAP 1310/34]